MSDALNRAFVHANSWIDGLETAPVQARMSEAELRAAFERKLPTSGTSASEVVASPTLNQGLVRFINGDRDDDDFTDQIIEAIIHTSEAFFSGTTWKGRRAMRVSVVNWRTTQHDVARAIAATKKVLTAAA